MSIDPSNGRVDFAFPWRSRTYESVNASCPVVFDNKVFISASYRTGGALVEIRPDFTHRLLWTTQEFGLHFNTPVYQNGYLYGFDGRNEPDASLACVDAATGKVVWRKTPEWSERSRPAAGASAAGRDVSRVAAGRRRAVPLPRRTRPPALDGSHAEGLPRAGARAAVRGARVVGAAGAEPGSALRRAEHADVLTGAGRGCSATTCAHNSREGLVGREGRATGTTHAGALSPPCAYSRRAFEAIGSGQRENWSARSFIPSRFELQAHIQMPVELCVGLRARSGEDLLRAIVPSKHLVDLAHGRAGSGPTGNSAALAAAGDSARATHMKCHAAFSTSSGFTVRWDSNWRRQSS